jgi:hypothetical protein
MEIAWSKPEHPIVLNAAQQRQIATLISWCANNIWKNRGGVVTDDTKLYTENQGIFYYEQLIISTIPHKIKFKWLRKYNVDVSKDVEALKDADVLKYLDGLYLYAKNLSSNFTKLV